jgi:hypothetical protein
VVAWVDTDVSVEYSASNFRLEVEEQARKNIALWYFTARVLADDFSVA